MSAALLLGGCSFMSDSLWPSLTGDDPSGETPEKIAIAAAPSEGSAQPTLSPYGQPSSLPNQPPQLGTGSFEAPGVTPFSTTGTFVGQKTQQMRGELQQLQLRLNARNRQLQQIRVSTTQNSQRYHGTMAAINTRLQLGTTPGNPVLINQWNQAQAELDRIAIDIAAMNSLANEVAADSSMSAFLLESARATYGLSGAIDEDHRQLAILEDETNRTVVLIDRLLNELSEDVSRQTTYLSNERGNLTTLSLAIKNGEIYGQSLANRAYLSAAPMASQAPALSSSAAGRSSFAIENRRPLVVIRFDRPDVAYEQALYNAVSRALQQRPEAQFNLVAVVPAQGSAASNAQNQTAASRQAQRVLRTLTDMGLPPSRVALSSTTSPAAATNEVHIYVR